jgi:hypothetical protein
MLRSRPSSSETWLYCELELLGPRPWCGRDRPVGAVNHGAQRTASPILGRATRGGLRYVSREVVDFEDGSLPC